jgi:hypothetical protein
LRGHVLESLNQSTAKQPSVTEQFDNSYWQRGASRASAASRHSPKYTDQSTTQLAMRRYSAGGTPRCITKNLVK